MLEWSNEETWGLLGPPVGEHDLPPQGLGVFSEESKQRAAFPSAMSPGSVWCGLGPQEPAALGMQELRPSAKGLSGGWGSEWCKLGGYFSPFPSGSPHPGEKTGAHGVCGGAGWSPPAKEKS